MDHTIVQAGLASAELAINKALAYDPAVREKLKKLAPKILAIEITQPKLKIYVQFGEQIALSSHNEHSDATLSGDLGAFLNLASHEDKHAALMKSDIQIHGSSQLAMGLADASSQLKIDWEAMIADITGPVVAHVIGNKIRGLTGWLRNTGQKVKDDSLEYVRDELQLTPHKLEGESRFSEIHKLKIDTDRIEARIMRLKKRFD
ncbi:MAG: SCP2 sterol-binding domain-containing protein [Bermanella sp.]